MSRSTELVAVAIALNLRVKADGLASLLPAPISGLVEAPSFTLLLGVVRAPEPVRIPTFALFTLAPLGVGLGLNWLGLDHLVCPLARVSPRHPLRDISRNSLRDQCLLLAPTLGGTIS